MKLYLETTLMEIKMYG